LNRLFKDKEFLEYEEFLTLTLDKTKLLNENNLKEAFDLFDRDKDGIIHSEEIKHILFCGKEVSDEVVKQFLEEIHKNIEDDITYEHFKSIMNDALGERTNTFSTNNSHL